MDELELMLEQVVSEIEPTGLLGKVKNTFEKKSQIYNIAKRSIEIKEQYKPRVDVDGNYRMLVKELLELTRDYTLVDDCFEYAWDLADSLLISPIIVDDALSYINRAQQFELSGEPNPSELLGFVQRTLSTLVQKCETRNEFCARIEEMEINVKKYNLTTNLLISIPYKMNVEVEVPFEGFNFELADAGYKDFAERIIRQRHDNKLMVDEALDFVSYYQTDEERKETEKIKAGINSIFNESVKEIKEMFSEYKSDYVR